MGVLVFLTFSNYLLFKILNKFFSIHNGEIIFVAIIVITLLLIIDSCNNKFGEEFIEEHRYDFIVSRGIYLILSILFVVVLSDIMGNGLQKTNIIKMLAICMSLILLDLVLFIKTNAKVNSFAKTIGLIIHMEATMLLWIFKAIFFVIYLFLLAIAKIIDFILDV